MPPSLPHVRFDASTAHGAAYRMAPAADFSAPSNGVNEQSWRSPFGQLQASEDALRAGARDTERYRIAQQIHDDLGGILTGLKACISVALERATRAGVVPEPLLLEASALADMAFATVRTIVSNLRPPIFEQMDLWEALEWRVAGLSRRTDIQVDYFFDAALLSIGLGEERALILFRVICEALTNVEKHAHAGRALVRLFARDGAVTVVILDDGIGMNEESRGRGPTLGIVGMRQRAQECGGELAVTSGPTGGTMVRLSVPLARGNGG